MDRTRVPILQWLGVVFRLANASTKDLILLYTIVWKSHAGSFDTRFSFLPVGPGFEREQQAHGVINFRPAKRRLGIKDGLGITSAGVVRFPANSMPLGDGPTIINLHGLATSQHASVSRALFSTFSA